MGRSQAAAVEAAELLAAQVHQTLRAHALKLLAQREHSSSELAGKLAGLYRRRARAASRGGTSPKVDPEGARGTAYGAHITAETATGNAALDADEVARIVDGVLADLKSAGWQSDERFAACRVQARSGRWGLRRITCELSQHGVALDEDAQRELMATELSRALSLAERRFGEAPPEDVKAYGRRVRYLMAQGFGQDTIRLVVAKPATSAQSNFDQCVE